MNAYVNNSQPGSPTGPSSKSSSAPRAGTTSEATGAPGQSMPNSPQPEAEAPPTAGTSHLQRPPGGQQRAGSTHSAQVERRQLQQAAEEKHPWGSSLTPQEVADEARKVRAYEHAGCAALAGCTA